MEIKLPAMETKLPTMEVISKTLKKINKKVVPRNSLLRHLSEVVPTQILQCGSDICRVAPSMFFGRQLRIRKRSFKSDGQMIRLFQGDFMYKINGRYKSSVLNIPE